MAEIKRSRKRSETSGMLGPNSVADPVARELIQQLQDAVSTMGLRPHSTQPDTTTPAQNGTIANLKKQIADLEERIADLEGDNRQKLLVKNAGPCSPENMNANDEYAYWIPGTEGRRRYDVAFPPYSVVEIIGRKEDAYLVTMPTEDNLPAWKLAIISESGLGSDGCVGYAYHAVSGINKALVDLYCDEPLIMSRIGTRKDKFCLFYNVMSRFVNDIEYFNETGAGFINLSNAKAQTSYGFIHDVVYEYQGMPGIHLGGYQSRYTSLPALPKHGVREVVVFEQIGQDEVAQVWRGVAGMPEYTPTQLLTNQTGVPAEDPNPWGEAGGL